MVIIKIIMNSKQTKNYNAVSNKMICDFLILSPKDVYLTMSTKGAEFYLLHELH